MKRITLPEQPGTYFQIGPGDTSTIWWEYSDEGWIQCWYCKSKGASKDTTILGFIAHPESCELVDRLRDF